MRIRRTGSFVGLALLALSLAPLPSAPAKIVALDLPAMMQVTDDVFHGVVTSSKVFRIDHPIDGPELYYTTLEVEGRSLLVEEEALRSFELTFPGGFITPEDGVHNSEMPHAHETEIGSEIVFFPSYTSNMGGDVAGSAPYAGHGGYYTVTTNRRGTKIVLGRGAGYAVDRNVRLDQLAQSARELRQEGGR